MQQALAISDELIAELLSAVEILIGTPMYNFTVPANLKAWIDLFVRPRVTHSGPPDHEGLVVGKTCKIIIASGGIYDEGCPLPHPTMNPTTSSASSPSLASPTSKSPVPVALPQLPSVRRLPKRSQRSFVPPSSQLRADQRMPKGHALSTWERGAQTRSLTTCDLLVRIQFCCVHLRVTLI